MPQYIVTITQNDAASVHSKSMMLLLYVGQCGGPGGRLQQPPSTPRMGQSSGNYAILLLCIYRHLESYNLNIQKVSCDPASVTLITLRKSHLRKTYLGGLSEVGLPESISHQKVPPQLLCFICTSIALFGLWGSQDMCTKGLMGIFVAEIDEITKVENSRKHI